MLSRLRPLTLLLVFQGLLAGCSSSTPKPPPPEDPTAARLRKIGLAYMQVRNDTGQPPYSVDQIKAVLKQMGEADPDSLLVSPRDGQPFTILWRVDTRQGDGPPDASAPKIILAYEQVGKDDRRYVLTTLCFTVQLNKEEFAKAIFPAGHVPK